MGAGELDWKRINPGHYVSDYDERFEIVRTPEGWEWTDRSTGNSDVEPTLRDAKQVCWQGGVK